MKKIKVFLVDDHKVVRQGIISMLQENDDYQILGEADNGKELLLYLQKSKIHPDIVLMDINMAVMDGIQCTSILEREYKDIKVITLSMMKQSAYIKKMLQAGAKGYILKSGDKRELFKSIDTVFGGENYYSQSVSIEVMTQMMRIHKGNNDSVVELSNREREVLNLIAKDQSNGQIADQLSISVRTVETHKQNLISKTYSKTIAGLIIYAIKHNLIDLNDGN